MDRRKRTARTVALMSLFSMTDTQENVPVASFYGDGSDLISLIVGIEPVQNLHGYDNPWPAGGGVNKLPTLSAYDSTNNGIRIQIDNEGKVRLSGTSSGTSTDVASFTFDIPEITLPSTDIYIHLMNSVANSEVGIFFLFDSTSIAGVTAGSLNRIYKSDALTGATINKVRYYVSSGQTVDMTFSLMLCLDGTAKAYAPYSNICPISGWTGANIHVSPTTDAADGTTYTITFPSSVGTVYGGTLDVTTGKMTVDRATIASYNGEQLPSTWISDRDAYAVGTTPTTGAQVVYKLTTPLVYNLTPTEINTLIGTNNIWADTGEIKYIEYNV